MWHDIELAGTMQLCFYRHVQKKRQKENRERDDSKNRIETHNFLLEITPLQQERLTLSADR